MSSFIGPYDAGKVNLIIGGIYQTGFADGVMHTLTKITDNVNSTSDALGNSSVSINRDNRHTLTVNYQTHSPQLKEIRRKAQARESFALSIIDGNVSTNELVSEANAYVMQVGDSPRGVGPDTHSVVFLLPNPTVQ